MDLVIGADGALTFSGDPYYAFRDQITAQINRAERSFETWSELLKHSNTAENADFRRLNEELNQTIGSIRQSIDGLNQTVKAVELKQSGGRTQRGFAHIDQSEIRTRRQFIRQARFKVTHIRNTMKSRKTLAKIEQDVSDSYERRDRQAQDHDTLMEDRAPSEPKSQIVEHKDMMQEIRVQQDEHLIELERTLGRIGNTSNAMSEELDEHIILLTAMDDDIDRSQETLNAVRSKIVRVLETDDNCHIGIILGLSCIVCLLVILILFDVAIGSDVAFEVSLAHRRDS